MRIRSTPVLTRLALATALVIAPLAAFAQSPSHTFEATGGFAFLEGNGEPLLGLGQGLSHDNDDSAFTASFAWNLNAAWALEAWMTWPSQRNIRVDGGADVASYDVRPVMVSVQHRFPTMAQRYRPFVGIGWQWTRVSNESLAPGYAELAPLQMHGDDGIAAVAGLDVDLGKNWFVRGDIRYLDSSLTTATGASTILERNSANTMAYGASIGVRF
ncbi:outer membrane beta-barrel protein [Lysobacter sp. KIS68-7]|uniref:OmpW/AlkL family protein n=1 Tax=Lysobacter sp. KIS68-7 TaxID=2904252 RepID=UPI001E28FE04|nr:OmpW family outer membrane protein [Lysobacter sp. KIS68-7]UHQ19413.1 outer membrane beta-barrel protein [Lysobacter sp. KIS68-7]